MAGPESSGKSWLAEQLQAHFGAVLVGEYVRYFIDHYQRDTTLADIPEIARGQLAWEDAGRAQAPELLILDTNLLTNKLWSLTLFGDAPRGSTTRCWHAITTCICCCRPKALAGLPMVSAASRTWLTAKRSSRSAATGWNSITSRTGC